MPPQLYGVMDKENRNCLGSNMVADGYTVDQAFGLELVTTFVLVLTVFATTDGKIPLTGCGINPARSFGPAFVAFMADLTCADNVMDDHYIFWIAPILGGLLAAATYETVLTDNWKDGHKAGLRDVLRHKSDVTADKVENAI
ncbi:hypothetical protein CYMTET_48569 [Cymbomonas tetramitiformis]|uniref:Uncharacterized protein n=1 Tax=Cymbomonas tetramitiformis TaxID=36881 RepID=A0AAE0BS05_9CHLO|nr:hypothetical protein CYMTET_48569 [Cymbomonas tetramitiformis]